MKMLRNQVVLPLDLGIKIDENDPVRKLVEICDDLDYRKLYSVYLRSWRKIDPAILFEILVFAYADGSPLTSIKRYPFRTLKSEIESLSFDISVTPETNSADVEILPSDEYTMFMWDVVDKAELNGDYNGDIASYIEAYIADMVENYGLYELDFAREMGPAGANLVHVFEPSTDYVVWAAQVDEFGNVVGEITTEEFTTLEDEGGATTQMEASPSLRKSRAMAERGSRR